jgi:hypothetical protein
VQYRVAYDVLDDWSIPGQGYGPLVFLGFALA